MEDVLEVYHRPYDAWRPHVCLDELLKQLVSETRVPRAGKPGQVACYDDEDERQGTANLFLFVEPLRGWRHVEVTARRTKHAWAHAMRDLVDIHYPNAAQVVVVLDNLNTHGWGSLYEAFPAREAKRIVDRLEVHDTPKHGSWLNIAEIEWSVLSRQCPGRRIPTVADLKRDVAAWEAGRNGRQSTITWRFTTADAHIKLKRLDPSL